MSNIALRPSYWASVSGGKDSLYMLYLILKDPYKYPLDGVVHFELEIDYPFVKGVIDKMEEMCKQVNVPFLRIKPRMSWYELYEKYGFPTRIARWCNNHYKLDAKKQLDEIMNSNGKYVVWYIGYCLDEVKRYQNRGNLKSERYPLVEECIEEQYILKWAKNNPIFNDYYKYNDRCGCMYCPMASMIDNAYLCKYYPDKYEKLMQMARLHEINVSKKLGRPFSVWSSNPKYNTDYRDVQIRKKYIPKLERLIENDRDDDSTTGEK